MTDLPKHRVSLVLADVDGTLVTEQKVLTERAIAAVQALRERGIKFAITSGRPPRGMAMLIAPLAIDTPIAGFNGGALVKPDLTVIDGKTLPPETARKAIEIIRQHKMDAWLYTAADWFIAKRDAPHVDREAWTVKFEPKVVERFADADLDQAVKIVGVSDDRPLVEKAEADTREALGHAVSAARSQPYYLDVTHPDANKGEVVETLARLFRIPKQEIVTLGDMPNDVLMFEQSGYSIAMGQSSDEVKKQAVAVTTDYNSEGFAKAIESFILAAADRPS